MEPVTPQLGRVFVSSVFRDMLPLRASVADAARRVGLEPVLTEKFVAGPAAVAGVLESEIRGCDTYVGIFGLQRGTVLKDGSAAGRAITEEELRIAREHGLRCLAFVSKDEEKKRKRGLTSFLNREVNQYETGVWARPWESVEELRKEGAAGLALLRPRVVLELTEEGGGLVARLDLRGVQPVWTGEAVLGPVPVDLALDRLSTAVVAAFQRGGGWRGGLSDAQLAVAGVEIVARTFPGGMGEALGAVLDCAAFAGRLLVLEVVSGSREALALPWEIAGTATHRLPVREGLLEVVRRIPAPRAEPLAPVPAAALPAEKLDVLGFTASPMEDEIPTARLGAGGYASSELFWEKEQEKLLVAFDSLLREGRGRLVLPEVGDRAVLSAELARVDRPQVVHLSCHGGWEAGDGGGRPVLLLEDGEGHRARAGSSELLGWVRAVPAARPVELLVLAACSTSGPSEGEAAPGSREAAVAAGPVAGMDDRTAAPGLAEALVRGGLPRVLGMQGTVSDEGATAFAERFYTELAGGSDLATALHGGRAALRDHGMPHEWAVPALLVTGAAGPLVELGGGVKAGEHPFSTARSSFDIAGVSYLEEGYVGRRDRERQLLAVWRRGERILVIHGLGGIGKSTFAARFLERRRAEEVRVLVLAAGRRLAPEVLVEEVARRVEVARQGGEDERQFRARLGTALGAEPTVLLLDNFEDNQDEHGALLDPGLGKALVELLLLPAGGLRLLLTTRVQLADLPGSFEPYSLDLGELSAAGCRKLRLSDPSGLGKLPPAAWDQALRLFGGHPKALQVLGGALQSRTEKEAERFVAQRAAAVAHVTGRLAQELQAKGRQLLIEEVLKQVPEERRPAFDRLCLLEVPLPGEELIELLAADGVDDPAGALDWLRHHGLLARKVADSALEGGDAVHRLLAEGRERALADREGDEAARGWHRRVAEHLVQPRKPLSNYGVAAHHKAAAGDRAGALGLYDRWAIALRNRHAYAACRQTAQAGLDRYPASEAEAERVAAARLWQRIHDGHLPLGKIAEAQEALDRVENLLTGATSPEARFVEASGLLRKGRLLVGLGQPQQAEEAFRSAVTLFADGGFRFDRAVTLGEIARLRAQAGDVSGALALHQERLGIFEQLGDVRERAVTLGDVARLRAQAGDVSGALALHQEMLGIFEQLGDVRERAVTLGDVARLRAKAGDVSGALALHQEMLGIFEQLGDVRERAVTLGDVAQLLTEKGQLADARKHQEEKLEVVRRIGDSGEIAVTQHGLALLDLAEQNISSARTRLGETWKILRRTPRIDGIAIAGQVYGHLLAQAGEREAAVAVLRESWAAFQLLGWEDRGRDVEAALAELTAEE
jgi:tetratricopeptide (TPR) repeat protein